MLAMTCIMGTDPDRFKKMIQSFEDTFAVKHDEWPKALTDAHNTPLSPHAPAAVAA